MRRRARRRRTQQTAATESSSSASRPNFPFVFHAALSLNRALQPAIRNFVFLFLGCLLFHVAGTWTLPLIDRDEPRFAEAAREMRQRGDYVIPYFNDHYRFDKPPLTYWFQTLSYRAFGENDFAARFPSAVAAALVGVLLLAWGRWMESERAGWWAAIIFTLCLQTFMHAKAAVADMWLVLFVTAAHWAGYELLFAEEGSKRSTFNPVKKTGQAVQHSTLKWWWIFFVSLALAFLAKGPIGWSPLLTVAAAKIFLRDGNLQKRFAFVRGILVMLAIVSLWAIPALVRTHGEFLRVGIGHHVIDRSFGAMEGHGAKSLVAYLLTLPFYFVTLFVSFFPWSIKLPWLTRKLWRERDAIDNYLIAGAAVIFLIFTLVKTKLPHYTLPAFPLIALLLARHWSREQNIERSFRRIALTTGAVCLAIALFAFPFTVQFFPSTQLLKAARNDLRPKMEFGAVGYNEPSLVWYFRSRVNGFFDSALDAESVQPFMNESGARFVIVPTPMAQEIFPALPLSWKSFSARGFNIAKGKRVDLTLILKPE
jgi:4-amino-4-deoxy-L-arabinose transferase-like glycosyltransferase